MPIEIQSVEKPVSAIEGCVSKTCVQATRIPSVINSWYVAVSVPRIWGGAVSAWYYGWIRSTLRSCE